MNIFPGRRLCLFLSVQLCCIRIRQFGYLDRRAQFRMEPKTRQRDMPNKVRIY
jgi:hypothetical protein